MIMPVNLDGFLLTVIRLADLGPLGPRVVVGSRIGCLGHHLNLSHGFRPVADRRAHAVVAGIAAADDDQVFILRVHILFIRKIRVKQTLCVGCQEIHRKVDALGVPARRADIAGIG